MLAVATELWWAWTEIAAEQEFRAGEWREAARSELAAGRKPSGAIDQETKAAMSAIVASAAAMETLGRSLSQFHPDRLAAPGAAGKLLGRLSLVFPDAAVSHDLETHVAAVFSRRNETLHYKSAFEEQGPHPLGIRTTWVARTFTVEAATQSVDTLTEVLAVATNPGTSTVARAEWWADRNRVVVKRLRGRAFMRPPFDLVP
jgi:hypothetical protein